MSYDAWKTRSDLDDDPTYGGTEEPCEKCGQKAGKYLMAINPAGTLLCEECAQAYEEEINSDEPKAIEPRLSCGCVGTCDSFAHDAAPDWDGRPSGPDFTDLSPREQQDWLNDHPDERCKECGNRCPEGDEICGHCAAANRDVEDRVNAFREGE